MALGKMFLTVFPNGQDRTILPARVANQSQRKIRFVMTTHGICHILKKNNNSKANKHKADILG